MSCWIRTLVLGAGLFIMGCLESLRRFQVFSFVLCKSEKRKILRNDSDRRSGGVVREEQ